MRQGRNGTSERGRQGTAPTPSAEPGLLAKLSKQCQGSRGKMQKDSVTLSPPRKRADSRLGGVEEEVSLGGLLRSRVFSAKKEKP